MRSYLIGLHWSPLATGYQRIKSDASLCISSTFVYKFLFFFTRSCLFANSFMFTNLLALVPWYGCLETEHVLDSLGIFTGSVN